MSQQLLDLINRFGGENAIAAMASRVGISPEQTQSAMAALMPAVAGGLSRHAETAGPEALDRAAAPAVAASGDIASDAAVSQGESLNGTLFGGSGAATVAARAAQATGLDPSILERLLPMVTTLAAGALHGSSGPGAGTAAPGSGVAGTLMGMLDVNKDGNPLDDIMGMAGKLFGR
jgi:hypothetical protein